MHWATREERLNLGQARRKQVARSQHEEFNSKARKGTALKLIEHSMKGRIPALVKLKYERMLCSPFGYFRGAAPVMAADLSVAPDTGLVAQLCGDAHVCNLGAYAAPDGRRMFDINDFDETIQGPFEWDLKRMAASIVLSGREAGHKDGSSRKAAELCVAAYARLMHQFAEMRLLEVSRWQVHRLSQVEPVAAALRKAEISSPLHTVEQLTIVAASRSEEVRRFRENKPILSRITGAKAISILASLGPYRKGLEPQRQHLLSLFKPVDVAFKVVGVGSVGLRDYCIYLEGNGPEDALFLQIKEETDSCYAPYLAAAHPPSHNGQRVAEGQKAMQMQTDPLLGWTQIGGRDYLVRQLNDHKGSIDLANLTGENLVTYAEVCGELLARGHARSSDPVVLSGYLGKGEVFSEAIADFGMAYANQTEKDWTALKRSGKI